MERAAIRGIGVLVGFLGLAGCVREPAPDPGRKARAQERVDQVVRMSALGPTVEQHVARLAGVVGNEARIRYGSAVIRLWITDDADRVRVAEQVRDLVTRLTGLRSRYIQIRFEPLGARPPGHSQSPLP